MIKRDRHKNGSYAFALYLKGWHQGDWHLQIIISKASFKINNQDPSTVLSTFNMDKWGEIHQHHWKKHLKISKI